MAEGQKRRLRVGLLLDAWTAPAWVARIVEDIRRSDFAEVAAVVLNETPPRPRSWQRLIELRSQVLYRLYMALDAKLFGVARNPFARADLQAALPDVPVVRVAPRQTTFSDYFPAETVEALRGLDLDVAFRFGFRILRGDVLGIARHGIWSFHHGDSEVNRGGPPGFWEVAGGEPVTGSLLQVLTEDLDAGEVLYRSWSATHPYSVRASRARLYNKTAAFALRALRALHETGAATPLPPSAPPERYGPYSRPLYRPPTNGAMVPLLFRLGGRMASAFAENALYRGAWFVAYKQSARPGLPGRLFDFKVLEAPRGVNRADPFPVSVGGRRYVFFEEWRGDEPGYIAVVELGPEGPVAEPRVALKRPYHLSYPFVFTWNGDHYMIPETRGNRAVELYRCVSFPGEWEREATLLEDVEAVDATLCEVDGRWWMWVNVAEPGASILDELHLYYAESPLGPWRPHRRNPVKSDVRNARPAGRLFRDGDALIRPAQDGSVRYGYAIVFNRVERLTPEEYDEVEVGRILPEWKDGLLGNHTFNHEGGLTVIDGYWNRLRWR